MSAVLSPAATAARPHPADVDVVGYVRGLPDDQQEAVFVAILKAIIADSGGKGYIPVEWEGEWLGYFVPPAAAQELFDRYGPKLSDEDKARVRRSFEKPGQSFTLEEMLERLREADTEPHP